MNMTTIYILFYDLRRSISTKYSYCVHCTLHTGIMYDPSAPLVACQGLGRTKLKDLFVILVIIHTHIRPP